VYNEYPFANNFLEIAGGRLHYIDQGSGPAIVMVHGNPTWSYYFRHLIKALQINHRVIAIDHMGCGLSDKPLSYPYCLQQHIENLEILINHLNLQKFSMVVHDWGGPIGLGTVINRLDLLDKLVILNTAAFHSTRIPWRIRFCRLPIVGEIVVRLFNGFAWPACYMAVNKKLPKETINDYLRPYNNWFNRVAISRFVEDIPIEITHPSYSLVKRIENGLEKLRESKIPLLILWGGLDFCFNDLFYNEWRKRFPEAEYHYFKDAGHWLIEDKKEECLAIMQEFLARRDIVVN
jgi:cis-3-alkyl-4-acyloxetan-2-one decarboxylase